MPTHRPSPVPAPRVARGALAHTLAHTLALVLLAAACARSPRGVTDSAAVGASAAATRSAGAAPAVDSPAAMPAAAGASRTVVYACPDGFRFSALVRNDSAIVRLPGRTVVLPQARSGSGARYEGSGVVFWDRGTEALLEASEGNRSGCLGSAAATPWDEARLLGVEFRAVGNEPGWSLDLDEGRRIRYVGDYGNVSVYTPAPEPVRDSATGTVTYRARTDARELAVVIRDSACTDAMSGERFTHSAAVTLDGRTVRGCGRTLSTDDVTGRYWRLASVGDTPAVSGPGVREAFLRLQDEGLRAVGSSGCNRFSGSFQRAGDSLRFSPLAMTRMACLAEAANRQEQALVRALEATRRAAIRGDTLVLLAGEQPAARWVWVALR